MGWQPVTNASQSWTTQADSMQTWTVQENVSAESRLNRIFPQDSTVTQEDVSYINRIQSEGPFFVATGTRVYIRSSITEPF